MSTHGEMRVTLRRRSRCDLDLNATEKRGSAARFDLHADIHLLETFNGCSGSTLDWLGDHSGIVTDASQSFQFP
eukprot:6173423-Pleurochrysis_carterae.AAC.1